MPSNARNNFVLRLREVDQLLEAHTALLQFHRASAAASSVTSLTGIATVVNHLVTAPGPGRPPQIQALNKAAIALLSGHLQGFITDLYGEAASHLLTGHVVSLPTVVDAAPTRGNPNSKNIKRLFATLGFNDILAGIRWQNCTNHTLRTRLNDFNELRNDIVHGTSTNVNKDVVTGYLSSLKALADRLDAKLRIEIHAIMGTFPW
jgi:hypothetical protein